MDYILLAIGYIFTFLVPGLFVFDSFFPGLPRRIKFPLVPIISILVSTYLVYLVSLVLGFSRYSILVSFSFFVPWLVINLLRLIRSFWVFVKKNTGGFVASVFVFALFFTALYPGIFTKHDGYFVMSSSNWQDTAMHAGIIESISQGNFPPQAPYFSGVPLTYYYFADFHSSIIETLYGRFFPRVLVYDNPLFAMMLSMAIYALCLEVTKNKKVSILSAILSPLVGNYMFTNFIKDALSKNKFLDLLRNNSYSIEFGGLFQISPMSDYFLQNRPMMVGIPSVILALLLSIYLFKKHKPELAFLVGAVSGMLLKFQFFAAVVSFGVFFFTAIFYFEKKRIKSLLRSILFFIVPFMLLSGVYLLGPSINGNSVFKIVVDNFSFGPWEDKEGFVWFLKFIASNLGFPFILLIVSLFIRNKTKSLSLVTYLTLALTTTPFVCRFTIMKYDMLKFFYFAEVLVSIVSIWVIYRIFRKGILFWLFSIVLVVTSVSTSLLNLTNSYLNKTMAYTAAEVESGYWIRENTPKLSVFLDLANLHSPATEVAGRLRVLSYINWPHSHGFNVGPDNVFSRLDDIKNVYSKNDLSALDKYNVNYVYYGSTERSEYPQGERYLEESKLLKKVFDNREVKIFKYN